MRATGEHELPAELHPVLQRARRLEWATIAYLLSVIVLLGLVMGSSQALRTAWVEDVLSLVPPIGFLIADRVRRRPGTRRFPYGFHRAVTVAYLMSSFTIFAFGGILLADGAVHLARGERVSIGALELFGRTVWQGWAMLLVLVWAIVPAMVLGRFKLGPARRLHDKSLYADARMNKADWLSGAAAGFGVVGIGLGWWWADAVGAIVISIDIAADGWKNLGAAIADLMDRVPMRVEHDRESEVPEEVLDRVRALPWVERAELRFREHGHVYFGEIWVAAREPGDAVARTAEVLRVARGADWRVHDLVVQLEDAE
jgi:cation diffusion facilitator family transporter